MSHHPIVHVEISSRNRLTDAEFYRQLFGWEFRQIPEMNYATFNPGEGSGGGLNPVDDEYPAGTIRIYIHTDDIDASLNKVVELGGEVIKPKFEIPGVGWSADFKDPTGNTISILQPLPM